MPTAVQCVSPTGSNGNSGLTWDAPKKDILGAWDALPATGGTIFFESGTYVDSVNTDRGLWIAGPNDPNYGSLPTGWRQQKTKGLRLIGDGGGYDAALSSGRTMSRLQAGSLTDLTKPAFWITGTNTTIDVQNVVVNSAATALRVGVAAVSGSRGINTANISFTGFAFEGSQSVGKGPTVDLGYVFWFWMEHGVISGNRAEAVTSDIRPAIYIDCTGVSSVNNFHLRDLNLWGGGIRVKNVGSGGWGYDIQAITHEGDFVDPEPPTFEIVTGSNTGHAYLKGIEQADSSGSIVLVKTPANIGSDQVTAVDLSGGDVSGPMTVLSRYTASWSTQTTTPARSRRNEMWRGRISAQHDSSRRAFAPTAIRFPNLADQDVTTWSGKLGTATVTTGKLAPDGTTNAAQLSSGAGDLVRDIYRNTRTIGVGDWIVAGCWVRAVTPSMALGPIQVLFAEGGHKFTYDPLNEYFYMNFPLLGDGEWEWLSFADKVSAIGDGSTETIMRLQVRTGFPMEYYAPFLLHVAAASALSDSEMMEMALHARSWTNSASATVGEVTTLATHTMNAQGGLKVGGGGLVSKILQASTTYDAANMAADGNATGTTLTVTGAAVGDPCFAGLTTLTTQAVLITAHVTAADTVRVDLLNKTGGALDLGSGTLKVTVLKP